MAVERIISRPIVKEMEESYLTYAMSVIVDRALPDSRDGLKPSQRRILIAMNDLNLTPGAKFRKCAKICGDTSGNYHPHGESIVYPTLVRMAQDWNMRYPLVKGQGNFGSIDGDSPAAMRYTEAKMTAIAVEMLQDLKEDTVPFVMNYDNTMLEPVVVPSRFPNLICNGATGIAVGMATSMPPHNLREVVEAITLVIDNPECSIDEIIEVIPGPDFPTGGIIMGRSGIHQGYHTGKGIVTMRGLAEIVERKNRSVIVITEIPYRVNKAVLQEKIAELHNSDKIKGIASIRDLSSLKAGIRIEIELRKDATPNVTLNQLYKYTQLQDSFSINLISLIPPKRDIQSLLPFEVDEFEHSQPQLLNIKQILEQYRDHRIVVIRRRTNFRLLKARARAHIVEGILRALDIIDQIIKLIRASADRANAHLGLVEQFKFSDLQAKAILDMTLARLTNLSKEEYVNELKELMGKIAEFEAILADIKRVYQIIKDELSVIVEKFGDDRRSEISDEGATDLEKERLIQKQEVVVTISHQGYFKRLPLNTYKKQARGGKGILGGDKNQTDFVEHLFSSNTHNHLLVFTDRGKVYKLRVWEVPEMGRTARGRSIANLLPVDSTEHIAAVYQLTNFADECSIVMATNKGVIKKTAMSQYQNINRNGIRAIKLDDDDFLIGVRITRTDEDIILGTKLGYSIRFSTEGIREQGRVTRGVRGIRLRKEDEVVDMIIAVPGVDIMVVSENGYGKRTEIDGNDPEHPNYRKQSRGGKGVINMKVTPKTGKVVALKDVRDGDELMLISENSQIVRLAVKTIRCIGRATQGVRLKKLDEGDQIVAVARILASVIAIDDENNGENGDDEKADENIVKTEKKPKLDIDEDKADALLKEFDDEFDEKLSEYEIKGFSTTAADDDEEDEVDNDESDETGE